MGCTIAMYCLGDDGGKSHEPHLMDISYLSAMLYRKTTGLLIFALLTGSACAQGVSIAEVNDSLLNFGPVGPGPDTPGGAAVSPVVANPLPETRSPHKFWDNENRV